MTRQRKPANKPCAAKGCSEPRHVSSTGKVQCYCTAHYEASNHDRKNRYRRRRGQPELHQCVAGRPQQPTVEINEAARTVRQIVGNLVVSACELPERGLHAVTLDILRTRGWRVRYVGAVREQRESA